MRERVLPSKFYQHSAVIKFPYFSAYSIHLPMQNDEVFLIKDPTKVTAFVLHARTSLPPMNNEKYQKDKVI